jgi:hypothetical protein
MDFAAVGSSQPPAGAPEPDWEAVRCKKVAGPVAKRESPRPVAPMDHRLATPRCPSPISAVHGMQLCNQRRYFAFFGRRKIFLTSLSTAA